MIIDYLLLLVRNSIVTPLKRSDRVCVFVCCFVSTTEQFYSYYQVLLDYIDDYYCELTSKPRQHNTISVKKSLCGLSLGYSGPERQHPLWIVLFFSYFDTFSTILNRILVLAVYRAFFVKNSTFLHLFMDIFMLINM